MTSEDKAKLLGLFFWLFTGFNVIIVGLIAIIYIGVFGTIFSQMPRKAGEPGPEVILPILIVVFLFVFIFTALFSIPKIIAGYGLRNHKPWARIWAIIASVMCCLSFPIGTAIGVFGLIFLLSDDGKNYFENASYGQIGVSGSATPPPPNSWQ
ncbi:MAG: hypothetical protein ACKVQJ_11800 [Pyrinomonadaceae bacterium]